MKYWLVIVFSIILSSFPVTGSAALKEDADEAYRLSIMATASVAAYSDRIGEMTTRYLEQNGWTIARYNQEQNQSGVRYLLAQKTTGQGDKLYVLAIVGTENDNDIKIDLKVEKVYFAGSTFEEFAANAALKDIPSSQPKVHRGFHEFIQAGPTAKLSNASGASLALRDILASQQGSKLYLTGHSLGGAAAIIAGARFIDMGVNPAQLEVITFGSPAVGNAAFAEKYESVLKVTRVVIDGDAVTGMLQTLVGGYKQFGREVKWQSPDLAHGFHSITGYVDVALKNYYEKRRQAREAGIEAFAPTAFLTQTIPPVTQEKVLIAPLENRLQPALIGDVPYMQDAIMDEYAQAYPNHIIAKKTINSNWLEQAADAECRWVIVPQVISTLPKNEKNTYRITMLQTVYETSSGAIVDMASFSTSTATLTPLEAFIHAFKGFRSQEETWLRSSFKPDRSLKIQ